MVGLVGFAVGGTDGAEGFAVGFVGALVGERVGALEGLRLGAGDAASHRPRASRIANAVTIKDHFISRRVREVPTMRCLNFNGSAGAPT